MLSAKPGLNIKDLTIELSESRKVLRRCLRMMVDAGALERRGNHRPKFYVAAAHLPVESEVMSVESPFEDGQILRP